MTKIPENMPYFANLQTVCIPLNYNINKNLRVLFARLQFFLVYIYISIYFFMVYFLYIFLCNFFYIYLYVVYNINKCKLFIYI